MDFCLLVAQSKFSWLSPDSWIAILQVVVGLGFIIFVHEAGHFLVAKACGVKCEKFYVGFDAFDIKIGDTVLIPRRLIHFQWGETEYGIGIIPLGGYVKMLGQDDNPANQARERERTMMNAQNAEANDNDEAVDNPSGDVDEAASQEAASFQQETELDPRSYPAKSVPQRLAIISAGVIMNMIFAVIFASTAFSLGAPYTPAVIGSTVPGSPAWKADIQPGTRVVQIDDTVKPPEHIRFKDLSQAILLTGAGHPIRLKCEVPGSESEVTYEIKPESGILRIKGTDLASIGIDQSALAKIGAVSPVLPGMAAEKANPPLEANDEIIAVNDVPVASGHELKRELARIRNEEAVFLVRRKNKDDSSTDLTVTIPKQPMKSLGVNIQFTTLDAIQTGSPADEAGLEPDDQILAIDGEPIVDILLISDILLGAAKEGRAVELTVQRGEGEAGRKTISVTPRLPRLINDSKFGHMPYGVDELGVAIKLTPKIASVVPGSSAERAGLQAGDEFVSVEFLKGGQSLDPRDATNLLPLGDVEFKDDPQLWPIVRDFVQYMSDEHTVKAVLKRGDESVEVELDAEELAGVFSPKRGFSLAANQQILKAKSMQEALSLGLRQTKEDAGTVYRTLRQMLIGRLSPINLRGPGTIAAAATTMAMEGLPQFLLFLTLISANLAVVNFLPIPVLDGGHAMFLLYEGIFRRPPPEKMVFILSIAGLLFILGLMFFVISMDVFQWL